MHSHDQELLERALGWLAQGRDVWLCTVVATWGSSPRPAGSMMIWAGPGFQQGSLSGGCVEEELLAQLATGQQSAPALLQYGVTREESERLGLPCGGTMAVLAEQLSAVDRRQGRALEQVVAALAARRCIRRLVDLDSGEWTLEDISLAGPLTRRGSQLSHDLGPAYRMLLVGAGELARWVARLALTLDYRVVVTDPRPEMRDQWDLTEVPCLGGMPDDVVREQFCDAHSIVITLTHDPRIDDMALLEALAADTWYVGALGSRRTSGQRRERLLQLGLERSAVDRLHAPVGLDIGSKRPPEIAIAILAELTALRARRGTGQ